MGMNIEAYYLDLKSKNLKLSYGVREFIATDTNGYKLKFIPFETEEFRPFVVTKLELVLK